MENKFRKVPAVEKCFKIIETLAKAQTPLGITEISKRLGLNKSTVYNITYTLSELRVLESLPSGKFALGTLFYSLASMSARGSNMIHKVHPYLDLIKEKTGLSVFLGVRSGSQAVLIDKVEADYGIKLSSEIGMVMPPLAGAGIKAMLSQLPEEKIDEVLAKVEFKRYTEKSIVDREKYKEEIRRVKREGVAYDFEEYIEGMVGLAVPVASGSRTVQSAIWVVGLKSQLPESKITDVVNLLISTAKEIDEQNSQKAQKE
ncbi:MAG: IclR family transcriptional regulator [Desulfobacterota bacterium]|nr:IclR family transcriptional regulator [Thermodesulfobacteriota bacterium]MDW8001654.1 IclR family transcriptional regulator [Deltaproteobacteria bacterium]